MAQWFRVDLCVLLLVHARLVSPYRASLRLRVDSVASVCKTLASKAGRAGLDWPLGGSERLLVAPGHSFGEVLLGNAENLASAACFA